jgi:uncharacterized protein (DUF983 family)
MTDPKHCPSFEQNKSLKTYICKCPECGVEIEVFSDELDKKRTCGECGKKIDVNQCILDGEV